MSHQMMSANVPTLGSTLQGPSGMADRPHIKQEAQDEGLKIPALPPNYNLSNEARERAMANLQDKFGATANAQISQLQRQVAINQAQSSRHETSAGLSGPPSSMNHDGAAEWESFVLARRESQTLREQQAQVQSRLEGGGLLLPLSQRPSAGRCQDRLQTSVPQMDGVGADTGTAKDELFDDEEDGADADAINSDLDDPDELDVEEDEEDGKPTQVMLCTYDKVQRVKNKWKCILRDGVLNSNGKE